MIANVPGRDPISDPLQAEHSHQPVEDCRRVVAPDGAKYAMA
jgi:hypothetical protein